MGFYNPPRWFVRELALIDPSLEVRWNNKIKRWTIYHKDGSPSLIIEHPVTHQFRPLDQRALRKMRINVLFTHSDPAMVAYTSGDDHALRIWIGRGTVGLSDYLSGWN